jgi:hypothetical protein
MVRPGKALEVVARMKAPGVGPLEGLSEVKVVWNKDGWVEVH